MSELEGLVVVNLEKLLANTLWKSPSGGTVPMNFYKGRLPERSAGTAYGLDTDESEHEEPFILVRETELGFSEPEDSSAFLLYAQLWDDKEDPDQINYDKNSGRDELRRLAIALRGIIRSFDFFPWSIEEKMSVQFGDEFGNQSDPEFVAVFKIKFYKGTESYG